MRKNNRGAITVIFLAVVALVLTLILAATQSQLLLSIRRSQSAADILVATYEAESEANDIMARLVNGYLDSADIPKTTKEIGNITLEIEGVDGGDTQTIVVTASKGLAVGKVQAIRRITSVEEVDEVEMVLMLDCTGSMNQPSGSPGQSRFNAQEDAAVAFVNRISELPNANKFKLGIGIFGINSAWLQYNGRNITPDSGMSYSQMVSAIETGFGDSQSQSPECGRINTRGTNVGVAYRHAHDYLEGSREAGVKQIEIVITDGEPNSRTTDVDCSPSISCSLNCEDEAKDYLRCTVASSDVFVSEISQNGVRNPEVDAYAVTIFQNPPVDVVDLFRKYATEGGYFNANQANQLTGILDTLLTTILEENSNVTIKRVIPIPQ
jgi:hypothetical protein